MKSKIIIADPSEIVRQGLQNILNSEFEIVLCSSDQKLLSDEISKYNADIIIINPCLINNYKSFSVKNIYPKIENVSFIALISGFVDSATIQSFDDYIGINDNAESIVNKLKRTVRNTDNMTDSGVGLSEREKEVLICVAEGLTNKEIADKLNISIHTVISHRKNITRKTEIKTVAGLTVYAVLNNLISQ